VEYQISYGLTVPLKKIKPNPWNVNKTTQRQQEAIAESLEAYGQVACLLCRKTDTGYEVIDGEHRYQELIKSNKTSAVINVIENISDAHAKKLSIILNETKGSADRIDLSALLTDISDELGEELGLGLPYSGTELTTLLEINDFNWEEYIAENKKELKTEDEKQEEEYLKLAIKVDKETKQLLERTVDKSVKDKSLAIGFIITKLLTELGKKSKDADSKYDEISSGISTEINFDN
jgi:hypothetical protein